MNIKNHILQGDCVHIMQDMPCESVDLTITDPPYLVRYRDRIGRTIINDDNPEGVLAAFPEIYRLLKPDSFCVSFYGWTYVHAFAAAWSNAGFRPVGHIVWHKDYASNRKYLRYHHEQCFLLAKGYPARPHMLLEDVRPWHYSGNRNHPTEKSIQIIKPLIESFSRPGDIVLDPFLGSGTTAVAAAFTDRRYIGIEIDQDYCTIARKRLNGTHVYLERRYAA